MATSTAEDPAPSSPNPATSSAADDLLSTTITATTTADSADSASTGVLPPLATSATAPSSPRRLVTSSSSSPGAPSSPSVSFPRLVRRQSTQERLDAILETARQRAESLAATQPRRSGAFVRTEPLLRNQSAPGSMAAVAAAASDASAGVVTAETESPDETTGIINYNSRQGSARHLNYQSIASGSASPTSGAQPRKRVGAAAAVAAAAAAAGRGRDPSGTPGEQPAPADSTPWWKSLWAGVHSIELENKGSVARDHLALERTFLAWLRTSLAFASIGIAVTQLFRLNMSTNDGDSGNNNDQFEHLRHLGRPLGTTFLGISILILFLGYHRYYQSQQWIMRGKFPASRGTILIVSLVALGLMVASLVVVIVVQPAV